MVDVNSTIQLLSPLITPIQNLLNILKVTVGGIFGLYVILVYLKWRESRLMNKYLESIAKDLKAITKKMGIVTIHKKEITKINKIKKFLQWKKK